MKRNEVYNTKQRELILNIIKNQKGSFTVKDLYEKLGSKVGLTTIYRLIDKMVRENSLNKEIGEENITRYQYLEKCDHANHFYLKCEKCERMEHIDCNCIEELNSHITTNHKFKPNKEHIIINGICSSCMKRGKENEKKF